jgi:hypothetical protein
LTLTSALIGTTAIAIALTSFDLRPAAADSDGIAVENAVQLSAPRHGRRGDPAVPLAAFGALAGAVASIASAQHRHESYGSYYPPYYAPYRYEPYRRPGRPHRARELSSVEQW